MDSISLAAGFSVGALIGAGLCWVVMRAHSAREIAEATDKVMTAGEAIQKSADTIAVRTKDRTTKTHVNRIVKNSGDLFEACSFQDITGQRIGKITCTVGAIEDVFHRLAALAVRKGDKKGPPNPSTASTPASPSKAR